MNQSEFEALVESTFSACKNLLVVKGGEYAGRIDRLANFKRGANLTRCTSLQVALIYLSKHYDAVATYIEDSAEGKGRARSEPIEGRLDDLINYCLLMKALIIEEKQIAGVVRPADVTQEEIDALLGITAARHQSDLLASKARAGERIGAPECTECGGRGWFESTGPRKLCVCAIRGKLVINSTGEDRNGRISTDDAGAGAQA